MSSKVSIPKTIQKLQETFASNKTRSYAWRIEQLKQLKKMLEKEKNIFIQALKKDLRRPEFECVGLELLPLQAEIDIAINELKQWMKPTFVSVPIFVSPATSEIHHEPFGVCLIIAAFNYPIELALGPLIGSIAAGNCCVIKPSEIATACEEALSSLLPKYLDNDALAVICGDVTTTTELLDQDWGKIFFTGSPRVGKIVMQAAAKNLTPVSLELGGKSPSIVDETVTDMALVARRIGWGKCANAGQTCIAPDYVLCHESVYEKFLKEYKSYIDKAFGKDPKQSPDFARIVSTAHTERLNGLLQNCKDCAKIFIGGEVDIVDKYVAPTVLVDIDPHSRVMQEEIFGPILPVLKYTTIEDIRKTVSNGLENPLAMYIFSKNRKFIDTITGTINCGSVVVNDTLFHFANPNLPFGGIGNSGIGFYHGKFSYEAFSHKKSIMRRDDHSILDVPVRYPPYTKFGLDFFQFAANLPAAPAISQTAFWVGTGTILIASIAAVVLGSVYK